MFNLDEVHFKFDLLCLSNISTFYYKVQYFIYLKLLSLKLSSVLVKFLLLRSTRIEFYSFYYFYLSFIGRYFWKCVWLWVIACSYFIILCKSKRVIILKISIVMMKYYELLTKINVILLSNTTPDKTNLMLSRVQIIIA